MRPSASKGSRAAATPCTLRRRRNRPVMSSILISGSLKARANCYLRCNQLFRPLSLPAFQLFEAHRRIRLFIVGVERIAARRETGAGRIRAIAESAADLLAIKRAAVNNVQRQSRVG